MTNNYFAKNLLFCRKLFKVTQERLANQLERSQTTVGGWENKVSEPNVDALIRISEFFGISIDNLIKLDLAGVEVNDLKAMFKNTLNVEVNVEASVEVIRKKARNYTNFEDQQSMLNEPDSLATWAAMKALKDIDGKIDRLLLLAENKPGTTGS